MNRTLCSIIKRGDLLMCADAKKYCTFKVGGVIEYLVCPKTVNDLCSYLITLKEQGIKYKVLGNMSNVLPADGINGGVYITTRFIQEKPNVIENKITVNSGFPLTALCYFAANNGLSGLENLSGIPATVGGAIYNNAGAFDASIADYLESVLVFSCGKLVTISVKDAEFGYRSSVFQKTNQIILSATFKLNKADKLIVESKTKDTIQTRHKMHPLEPSAGSVFKKYCGVGAGYYIDQAGLKGTTCGGAKISEKHANFIVNMNNATSEDVKSLINLAKETVKAKFNIVLEREIEFLGENYGDEGRLSYT